MWPFRSSKPSEEEDEQSVYTEEEYEEDVEYEMEVTDDEADEDDNVAVGDNDQVAVFQSSDVEEMIEEETAEKSADCSVSHGTSEIDSVDDHAATTRGDDDDEEEEDESDDSYQKDESQLETEDEVEAEEEDEEEEEAITSLEEKHLLLKLAAEHDRVDILQSILSSSEESSTPEERLALLNHKQQPPLHVAVSFGSTSATTCLLRLGANPALRPETSDMKKIVGRTAWELAFGSPSDDQKGSGSGWFSPSKGVHPVDMAPSKREGIRHAFTAEALRSIGADDVVRLSQLLESGMPQNTDIGGDKDIVGWCREMGAVKCLKLLVKDDVREESVQEEKKTDERLPQVKESDGTLSSTAPLTPIANGKSVISVPASTPVIIRRNSTDKNDQEGLRNRLEELDTLAISLSTYLDNLAEEVSVCHGLLLMGNGASALASHVRALRETQEFLRKDLQDRSTVWADTEAELDLYMRRYMVDDDEINVQGAKLSERSLSLERRLSSLSMNEPMQLRAQVEASENKIRKLRASIADMSEESEEAMKEVEKRGLTGGINLVRKLREQIRELEFQISEAKSGEAFCKAKLQLLHQKELRQQRTQQHAMNRDNAEGKQASDNLSAIQEHENSGSLLGVPPPPLGYLGEGAPPPPPPLLEIDGSSPEFTLQENVDASKGVTTENRNSERILLGQSDAIMKYNPKAEGYMPLDLWQIILRIIGLGRVAVKQQVAELKKQSSNVMIV